MVVWLVGISSAGKSTLGTQLNKFLITRGKPTFLINGDAVRQFYNNELGYTEQDRRENTRRIMFAVKALSQKKYFFFFKCYSSVTIAIHDLLKLLK